MQTLQIDEKNARKLYSTASAEFKQMLHDSFGENFFRQKITDRVKTFEDACEVLGIDPDDVLHAAHSEYLEQDIDAINAFQKLTIIARALNEGWIPDWNNSNQRKWCPWLRYSGSGFRFGDSDGSYDYSSVGSRLCYKSEELATYAC